MSTTCMVSHYFQELLDTTASTTSHRILNDYGPSKQAGEVHAIRTMVGLDIMQILLLILSL